MPTAGLLRTRGQHLDLPVAHARVEYGQPAVARVGAPAGQRVEFPLVVRASQRAPLDASLTALKAQVGAAVREGPDLSPDVGQDDLLPAQPQSGQFSCPEVCE